VELAFLSAWVLPKLYSLVYWRNKVNISARSSFDLYNLGVRQRST